MFVYFEGVSLQTDIFETLNCRGTVYERDSFERLMTLVDDEDMMKKWSTFVKLVDEEL